MEYLDSHKRDKSRVQTNKASRQHPKKRDELFVPISPFHHKNCDVRQLPIYRLTTPKLCLFNPSSPDLFNLRLMTYACS